jgi:hypothetical protein
LALIAIDNLWFLWYPARLGAANGLDFQAMGRAFLTMFAKFICLGLTTGAAALVGFGAYVLFGQSLTAAIVAAWVVMDLCAVALVPLVAFAFSRFDVAAEILW